MRATAQVNPAGEPRSRKRMASLAALILAVFLALPAAAHAASIDAVTLFSDQRDFIGKGMPRIFDAADGARITPTGTPDYVTVTVAVPGQVVSFSLEFAAPPGQTLAPGVYDDAERAPFRQPGHPGINIWRSDLGCDVQSGRFEVKDIAFDASGTITRLWIVFEQHCEALPPGLFGEVRVGMPVADAAALSESSVVRWPADEFGRPRSLAPVVMRATAPTGVTAAAVTGPDAADFAVALDECAGVMLTAGASCKLWMRFTPGAAGARTATLDVTTAAGDHQVVALQGFTFGGTTRLVLDSEPGDFIGAGVTRVITPADAEFRVSPAVGQVSFEVLTDAGVLWNADFAAPGGAAMAPGEYPGALEFPFNGAAAGLDVFGDNRGCNTLTGQFTVTQAAFDLGDRLRNFGATYVQHCEGDVPALRGAVDFRSGDTTPVAPWMVQPSLAPGGAPPQTGGTPVPLPGSEPPAGSGGGAPAAGIDPTSGDAAPGTDPQPVPAPQARRPASAGPCGAARSSHAQIVRGTEHGDDLRGASGPTIIVAGAGRDRLRGRSRDDCLDGGSGDDVLDGGRGADRLFGGGGDDVLIGGRGRDVLDCGPGSDVAHVTRGDRVRGCERVVRSPATR